jgi:hypothetical protein
MLDIKIDARVSPEAWHVINLKHPRLQLMIKHDIETE